MSLIPLEYKHGAAGTIQVVCFKTKQKMKWNNAALSGWVCDSEGEPFNAYYSPEGIKELTRGSV